MRFRLGRATDVPVCLEILRAHPGTRLPEHLRSKVPALWRQLLAEERFADFTVFEDEVLEDDTVEICGFAMTAFIPEGLFRELKAAPEPYMNWRIYERQLRGEGLLLNVEEVREASATGLYLAVLHFAHVRGLEHAQTQRMMAIVPQAWHFHHAGYPRMRGIVSEVYGRPAAELTENGGFKIVAEFAVPGGRPEETPFMVRIEPEDARPGVLDRGAASMFHAQPARFFFTRAEQRLLVRALLGGSDKQIAQELDVTTETIRSAWDTIYTRVGRVSPRLLRSNADDETAASGARGVEKRRALLDYLRQHLEELRPVQKPR